jgi:hypothetical protein
MPAPLLLSEQEASGEDFHLTPLTSRSMSVRCTPLESGSFARRHDWPAGLAVVYRAAVDWSEPGSGLLDK